MPSAKGRLFRLGLRIRIERISPQRIIFPKWARNWSAVRNPTYKSNYNTWDKPCGSFFAYVDGLVQK